MYNHRKLSTKSLREAWSSLSKSKVVTHCDVIAWCMLVGVLVSSVFLTPSSMNQHETNVETHTSSLIW